MLLKVDDFFTCLCEASRTLRSLPRSGYTPYLSRPTTPKPATAKVLAESPSVKIKVQSNEFLVPASLASSNLAMPFNLLVFLPVCLPFNCWSALNLDQANTDSTIPHFSNCLLNLSVKVHLEPNLPICNVIISFVCESKVGLVIKQLTKTHIWFLIWWGLIWIPALFFFLSTSVNVFSMILVTWSMWRPPLVVAMELTKDI